MNSEGRGPAWSNSLFEDNAEFGLGMRLAVDQHMELARKLLTSWRPQIGDELARGDSDRRSSAPKRKFAAQRERVAELKGSLAGDRTTAGEAAPARSPTTWSEERLDRRRRRLGLRHRLRRPGPRAGDGPQREHPGARHRGLFEHRRPSVEVDAARRRGQVRRRRQASRQEGPRRCWR